MGIIPALACERLKNVTHKGHLLAKNGLFATSVTNKQSAGGLFATLWPVLPGGGRYAVCVSGEVCVVGGVRPLGMW